MDLLSRCQVAASLRQALGDDFPISLSSCRRLELISEPERAKLAQRLGAWRLGSHFQDFPLREAEESGLLVEEEGI